MIYNPFIKAKRTFGVVAGLCLITMLPFLSSCSEIDEAPVSSTKVPIKLHLQPVGQQQTRTYIGDIDAENGENAIKSAKVWFFQNGNRVAYSDVYEEGEVNMNVDISAVANPVDIYIVANSEGIDPQAKLNESSSEEELKAAVLEGTLFTPGTPTEAVPTTGLPMSRIVKGVSLQESTGEIKSSLGTIEITRAVSKIKFAFARSEDHPGEIIGIELNNRMIATGEYVFPEDSLVKPANYEILTGYRYLGDREAHINKTDANNTYINVPMLLGKTQATFNAETDQPLVANENILEVKNDEGTIDPSIYVWTNWVQQEEISPLSNQQKAVQYYSLMNDYTRKTVYLRESDRALQGKIYYRLHPDTPVKTAEFNMIYTDLNDFTRNHIWIVYGYFLGDKFNLIVQTIPWEDSEIFIDYTQTVSWKDGGAPSWTPTLTDENSGTETFEEQTYTVIYTNGGDTPSLSFTLDSPEGWEWVATLEPLTDGAANFISFADGSTVATGNVGQSSTLNFRIATTSTSVNHRARLRLFVRTTSGDQSFEVQNVKYIISRNI